MQINVYSGDRETRGVNEEAIRNQVRNAVEHFQNRITRVDVHLKDLNGPKSGNDKQCTMEARVAGLDPMAVTAESDDLWNAIVDAAGKLQRKLHSDLEKRRAH